MYIGLHDSDATRFPNLAQMKIFAYHKARGDKVEIFNEFFRGEYDIVYSSKVFTFSAENPYLPANTIKGGTGYGNFTDLPPEIDGAFPDYSIYPGIDYAIGFLTRGCVNKCDFCVVPRKEGGIRPYCDISDIIRPDSDKVVLMDNNILACDHGLEQLEKISGMRVKIDINQGMDLRLLTADIIQLFSKIKWISFIRFSCDCLAQVDRLREWYPLFKKYKMHNKLFLYFIVRSNIAEAETRIEELKKIDKNLCVYSQAERDVTGKKQPSREMLEFAQRYVYGRRYKKETFTEYKQRLNLKY